PTTGVVVRMAAALRGTPYVYFAADVWSDAIELGAGSRRVASIVRGFERIAMGGAAVVAAVTEQFASRIAEIVPRSRVAIVGNGYDELVFTPEGPAEDLEQPYLLYAGTASEPHGAGIFVEAWPT